jgi:hypothetical protein
VAVGDTITVTVQRGELACEVTERKPPTEDHTP